MKILAKYKDERVILVNIRQDKGYCDIIRTKTNEHGKSVGYLDLVAKNTLTIIDGDFLVNEEVPMYTLDKGKATKYDEDLMKNTTELREKALHKLENFGKVYKEKMEKQ